MFSETFIGVSLAILGICISYFKNKLVLCLPVINAKEREKARKEHRKCGGEILDQMTEKG